MKVKVTLALCKTIVLYGELTNERESVYMIEHPQSAEFSIWNMAFTPQDWISFPIQKPGSINKLSGAEVENGIMYSLEVNQSVVMRQLCDFKVIPHKTDLDEEKIKFLEMLQLQNEGWNIIIPPRIREAIND